MADKGTIKGKDLITDEGLQRPLELKENLEQVLSTTKELVKIALQYNKLSKEVKVSKTEKEYLQHKKRANALDKDSIRIQKLLSEAEIKLQKEQQARIKTQRDALLLEQKKEAQTKRNTKLTIKERVEIQAKNKAQRLQARIQLGLVDAYEKLNRKRNEAQRTLQNLLSAEKQNDRAIRKARRNFERLDKRVKAVDKATHSYVKNIGNYKSGLGALNGVVRSLITSLGVVGGFSLAVDVVKNAYRQAKELDVLNKSLKAVVQTEEQFGKSKAFLSKIADDYGIKLDNLTKSYVKFRAASKGTNLEGEQTDEIFRRVNKASALLGLSADENTGVLRALEQIMSKGKVQAEELRGQLGDRLPGAFNIMARAIGVSTAELDKMLKNGEVFADEVLPKFAVELEKTFGADKVDRVDNLVSAENRFSNAWIELIDNIEEGNGAIGKTVLTLLNIGTALVDLVTPTKDVTESIQKQQLELNTLRFKILNVNTANEDRVKLINKLKADYPDLLGNIDAETVSNDDLETALKKVNQQLVNKIVLAKKQKEIDEQAEVTAEKFIKVDKEKARFKNAIAEGLSRANDFKLDGAKTDKENAKALNEYLKTNEKYTNQYDHIIKEINQSMITLKHNSNILNTEQEKGLNLEKEKNRLAKEFNLLDNEDYANKKEDEVKVIKRNVEHLNKLISTEKENLKLAENRDGAKVIQDRIKLLQKEVDTILGKSDAVDTDEKKQKRFYNTLFDLEKFRKEQEIKIAGELSDNESLSIEKRLEAVDVKSDKELELAQMVKDNKVKLLNQELIESELIGDERIKLEQSINNQKELAYEEYKARKKDIEAKEQEEEARLLKVKQSQYEKELNEQLNALSKKGNEDITLLNEQFSKGLISQEDYEKRLFDIKAKYAKLALGVQIDAIDKLLNSENLSADQRAEYENKLYKIKRDLSDAEAQNTIKTNEERLESEKRLLDTLKQLSADARFALQDIGNSLFEGRIQNIDRQIQKNDEYYSNQLELAKNDQVQQKLIEEEGEKRRTELEKKKRKEQRRQAIFNKALAITDIGIDTAKAVAKSVAESPLTFGLPWSAFAIATGALQAATVLAKPIPAYEFGTEFHPEDGPALLAERRAEVVEEPGKDPYIVYKPSILDLPKGTRVTPSVEEYNELLKQQYLNSIYADNHKVQELQSRYLKTGSYGLSEADMKDAVFKGVKSQPVKYHTTTNVHVDIGDKFWRSNNEDW